MKSFYAAKYTPIDSGYTGQIVGWPEVVTEGSTLEDALREMVAVYAGMKKEPPVACQLSFPNIASWSFANLAT